MNKNTIIGFLVIGAIMFGFSWFQTSKVKEQAEQAQKAKVEQQIEMTAEAKNFLADKGYDIQYGARPLKRALQNYVEDEISELLLDGALQTGDTIIATVGEQKLKFEIRR
jgi:ATP-dependent Clp protease ATP-binding subunit ClpA